MKPFVVLRCSDLQKSVEFYTAQGLTFVLEKHGNGPEHFAADTGSLVIELYQAKNGNVTRNLTIGLPDAVRSEDPDGNLVRGQ